MGTIRDLIAYRMRNDHFVERASESVFKSDYGGDWKAMTYRNKVDGTVNVVLQKGKVIDGEPTLVRMHSISIFHDLLGQAGARKRVLQRSMMEIGKAGAGLIVLLMPNDGEALTLEIGGETPPQMDLRTYGIGAQILADLGVHDMVLLTNAHRNVVGLDGYGINIIGERAIPEV
jgi:3,4-dihydroxy 2-butanone 4-phosphate synthase / GTP cyclohydrolase II